MGVFMMVPHKPKFGFTADPEVESEYKSYIQDLIQHELVLSMREFIQHGDVSCLEHSLYVSYNSYLICRKLGFDCHSAARGGLLHDFFLYDWHGEKPYSGLHGFMHPYVALQNANKYFSLNELEKDIIIKHMWPLTIRLPRYKESLVVLLVDKYCAAMEVLTWRCSKNVYRLKEILGF
jgi:hypothetical protein